MPEVENRISDHRKLTRAEDALILRLSLEGHTQVQIAEILGCHQSSISRCLAELDDTRLLATHTLRKGAVKLAETVVRDADVDQALEVLDRLEVAVKRQPNAGANMGVQIVIGMPGQPVGERPILDLSPSTFAPLPPVETSKNTQ